MREVFMIVGPGDTVLWSDASNSPTSLPDRRARWEAIWSRRTVLVELAHSHPIGPLAFSAEDESTMAALASALGRPTAFSVVAPRGMIRQGPSPTVVHVDVEPWWAALLRLASGMHASRPPQLPEPSLGTHEEI